MNCTTQEHAKDCWLQFRLAAPKFNSIPSPLLGLSEERPSSCCQQAIQGDTVRTSGGEQVVQTCPQWCTPVQSRAALSKAVQTCLKQCRPVHSGAHLSKVVHTYPKWCTPVQSGTHLCIPLQSGADCIPVQSGVGLSKVVQTCLYLSKVVQTVQTCAVVQYNRTNTQVTSL